MQYAKCQCGKREFWGSGMLPAPCQPCGECGTVPGSPPKQPAPHEYTISTVETDNGLQPLTRCRFCLRTKNDIESENE